MGLRGWLERARAWWAMGVERPRTSPIRFVPMARPIGQASARRASKRGAALRVRVRQTRKRIRGG